MQKEGKIVITEETVVRKRKAEKTTSIKTQEILLTHFDEHICLQVDDLTFNIPHSVKGFDLNEIIDIICINCYAECELFIKKNDEYVKTNLHSSNNVMSLIKLFSYLVF